MHSRNVDFPRLLTRFCTSNASVNFLNIFLLVHPRVLRFRDNFGCAGCMLFCKFLDEFLCFSPVNFTTAFANGYLFLLFFGMLRIERLERQVVQTDCASCCPLCLTMQASEAYLANNSISTAMIFVSVSRSEAFATLHPLIATAGAAGSRRFRFCRVVGD